jgi:hypothetical protein
MMITGIGSPRSIAAKPHVILPARPMIFARMVELSLLTLNDKGDRSLHVHQVNPLGLGQSRGSIAINVPRATYAIISFSRSARMLRAHLSPASYTAGVNLTAALLTSPQSNCSARDDEKLIAMDLATSLPKIENIGAHLQTGATLCKIVA